MNNDAPLLDVQNLAVPLPAGGDRPFAVKDISYNIHQGEIVCIVGESGSGKSVSANAIMGLLPEELTPTNGRIVFQGKDLLQQSQPALRDLRGQHIGMIFQEPLSALNPLMTVGRQISEIMQVHDKYPGEQRRARVLEMLDFVGLPDPALLYDSYPFRLSGGQRQRVMIAMALALEPALLIADEPTTALDMTTQAQILNLILRIQAEKGMGVMFITHDFGVVAEIAHRVVVMEKGLTVEQGPVSQVLNEPQHPYTKRLIAAVPHAHNAEDGTGRPAVDDSSTPVLEVRNLHKTYVTAGGLLRKKRVVPAVSDVSFTLRQGETLGVVGESGSGKSTLGRCLLKLMAFEQGELIFNGTDIAPLTEREFRSMRRHMQMVFQDPFSSLNPRHTIGKTISDGPVANGVTRGRAQERARELLKLVGLDASAFNRYPNQFSGGQRQRVGIARALALDPKLLIADEAVSALDVSVQAQVLELLNELQQKLRIAMLFITHDLRVAAKVCDAVIVMHQGKVVEQGPPATIFNDPQHPYTKSLIAAIPGKEWDPSLAKTA